MSEESTKDNWWNYLWFFFGMGLIALFRSDDDAVVEVRNWLLDVLYIIWLIIKWPLIVIGGVLAIYALIKFIKRCREN